MTETRRFIRAFKLLLRALKYALLTACATGLFLCLGFIAAVEWWAYPEGVDRLPSNGTFIEDRNGVPLAALVAADGQWRVPLSRDQISPHLLHAMIAVEDARFESHSGVDWRSVAAAAWQDARHLRIQRGASTLSMQLQRLRDPRPRTLFNKFEQAVRAKQLEKRLSKAAILLEYLNRAPFGGNLVGAGAASWRYFGKPCADLSLAEAALLAGLPQNPNRLRPDRNATAAIGRRDHVLDRMRALGMIDARHYTDAVAEPMLARWNALPQDADPDAMPTYDSIVSRFRGQIIRTTLDVETQRLAGNLARAQVQSLAASGVTACAVVVLDTRSSECLASISHQAGDRDSREHGVDLAHSSRSTGSTLKPFIYAAAFDAGICTPGTMLLDSPAAWPGYAPSNYDRRFRGPIPAADALAESRNIPALVLLGKLGVEKAIGILGSFGFTTLERGQQPYGLSLAVGGAEASPVELAEAYATLARGGIRKKVSFVPTGMSTSHEVLQPESCWQTLHAISQPDRTRSVCPEAASLGVAWKTGTSSGHRDAWCAAVTPRRTVVVWLGNPAGESAASLVGQEVAAPLALRLIASFDEGGRGWPTIVSVNPSHAVRPIPISAKSESALQILSPHSNQRIILSSDQSPERQQVSLEASHDKGGVWWFVDGSPAGAQRRLWWTPSAGPHRLRAVDGEGRTAEVSIHVDTK